jgi:stage V sporulation protein B
MTFAILRTFGLLGVGWLFVRRGLSGALGSTVGFVLAAACIVPLAVRRAGTGRRGGAGHAEVPEPSAYLAQLFPLALAQLGTNVLMQVDITILGRYLSQGASAVRGWDAAAIERASDEWVAVYRACQLFAFLPYQLLFSVTQVLFPMLARAKAEGDDGAVARYVARGSRIAAIACGLIVSVIVAAPGALLHFAYGTDVATRGRESLHLLALGQGAFAMLGVATTVLASLGRERLAAIITAVACAAVAAACFATLPGTTFGDEQLELTALATAGALGAALVAGMLAVYFETRAFVPIRTAARTLGAVTLAFAFGLWKSGEVHFSRPRTIALCAAIALAYVAFLVVTGEIGKEDLASVRAIVARRVNKA